MKRKILFILLVQFVFLSAFAQSNKDFKISGIITDTLDNPLISATIILLEESDSTMVDFTQTTLDGSFKFKDVPGGNYMVKSTYIGYLPLHTNVTSGDGKDVNVGTLQMVEIASALMAVVIKAAKAPILIRGDTIEYDATTFKVPQGSTVEELLRQLPGMEVDMDGAITSDGKNVSKVTVDGKKFFGSDPKAATKNLPAEGISKVQVFDTKTEEEEVTGIKTEGEDRTMNLELKDEFKTGGFGKVLAGGGTEGRAELKGNYNKFDEKMQFSLVGVGNNTGRNGLGWDDYQDFMGSESFNFEDDGDYGFGGGGRHYYNFSIGDDDDIESDISSVFFSGNNQGGFPENYNGGVNYNYDHEKTKLSSYYFYNQSGIERESFTKESRFLPTYTLNNVRDRKDDNLSRGHRGEITWEQELDSMHTIKLVTNGAWINKNQQNDGSISLSENDQLTSSTMYDNGIETTGQLYRGTLILRKKFKKTGRRFGANGSFMKTSAINDGGQQSDLGFYNGQTTIDSSVYINQITYNDADKTLFKANAIYVEPLSKRLFWQTFYNYSNRQETGDRDVTDVNNETTQLNEYLSRTYENTIGLNRVGSSIRYSHKGINISLGGAWQQFRLDGIYNGKGNSTISGIVDKTFVNWIPNFSFSMNPKRTSRVNVWYSVSANEPSIRNLQPIIDNRNPLYITEGNPELVPELSQTVGFRYHKSWPAAGSRINFSGNYNYYKDQIIKNETVDRNLITYTKPINHTGGDRVGLGTWFSFPIIPNKIKVSTSYNFSLNNSFSFVNDILNKTNSLGHRPTFRITYTPKKDISFNARASYNLVNTTYDVHTSQNQESTNSTYALELNTKTVLGIFLNSSFRYSIYKNDRFNFDQSVPILNVSLYKHFLKGNKAEVRISLYDGFDESLSISQYPSGNGFIESQTYSLGRYVMLSLAYNIKGMKTDLQRKGRRGH